MKSNIFNYKNYAFQNVKSMIIKHIHKAFFSFLLLVMFDVHYAVILYASDIYLNINLKNFCHPIFLLKLLYSV